MWFVITYFRNFNSKLISSLRALVLIIWSLPETMHLEKIGDNHRRDILQQHSSQVHLTTDDSGVMYFACRYLLFFPSAVHTLHTNDGGYLLLLSTILIKSFNRSIDISPIDHLRQINFPLTIFNFSKKKVHRDLSDRQHRFCRVCGAEHTWSRKEGRARSWMDIK